MRLPAIFADHMVVQHNQPVPVWGWSKPGQAIEVTLAGKSAKTSADNTGAWRVTMPAVATGGPYEMKVAGDETLNIGDVLAGEVWVCSGQSNMEWSLDMANNPKEEIAAANYPQIRLLTVPRTPAEKPSDSFNGTWSVCAPGAASRFSAVGYFFGRKLFKELNVPIGLINTSWGGTRAEAWTSLEGLKAEPTLKDVVTELELSTGESPEDTAARYAVKRAEWYKELPADKGNRGEAEGWAKPDFNDSAWKTMAQPCYWQQAGHATNGVFWFRMAVEIPAAWAGRELQLSLGALDKSDITYFNGKQVGSLSWADEPNSWNVLRKYTVPAELVKPGRSVIAVRVLSNYTGGGMAGPSADMNLRPREVPLAQAVALDGDWKYAIEQDFGRITSPAEPQPPLNANMPTALYNGMIAPLVPYGIRGAIWYQGESNAGDAERYRTLFPAMIKDWRRIWKQGEFPFYFVQLANYGSTNLLEKCNWPWLRDAQTRTLALPNTGMAVIIDIGDALDIHPRNKQDVGLRLALNALAKTYGKKVAYRGPVYKSSKTEASSVRISFENAAGLRSAEKALGGFVIAGGDKRFVLAQARIDGETVVVSSPEVPAPAAVRYGWADSPICTLYNEANLPAEPFRTDNWPR